MYKWMDSIQCSERAKRRLWDREHCPCCVSGVSQKFYFLHFSLLTLRTEAPQSSSLCSGLLISLWAAAACVCARGVMLVSSTATPCRAVWVGLLASSLLFWLFQRGELILCCHCIPFADFVKLHALPFSVLFTVFVTRMGHRNFNAQYSL